MSLHDRQPTRLSSTRERQWFVYGHRHKYANHKLEYRIIDFFLIFTFIIWFGGGFVVGILGGIARAGFSHRESTLPDPLNY
jgi:hypothetical protein